MELPIEILKIIKEYSMPVTRGDWRKLHKYTKDNFEDDLYKEYNKTIRENHGYYYAGYNVVIIPSEYVLYLRVLTHTNGCKYRNEW